MCCGVSASAEVEKPGPGWDAAVVARAQFEAEGRGTHTREEYARVMNAFRAIYHADPDNEHAAEAVAQVAELLREQGLEFGDKKSVHDAAGQYEYLAKAYPGDRLAPEALVDALGLLGAADADEAARVRAELVLDYPRDARAAGVEVAADTPTQDGAAGSNGGPGGLGGRTSRTPTPTHDGETVMNGVPGVGAGQDRNGDGAVVPVVGRQGGTSKGPLAVVTGIRHWSTASYTRVAIDLNVPAGEEIKYEAARVENPDRIFFDFGHARLAQEMVGKSFTVTDDGFLTRVRAAQYSGEVTRVVLDVHHVAEYSAFLLPNPLRLIIDIHGGSEGQEGQGLGIREQGLGKAEGPGPRDGTGCWGGAGFRGEGSGFRGGGTYRVGWGCGGRDCVEC